MNLAEEGVEEVLRLARDLCMGTASFAVASDGTLRYDLLATDLPTDLGPRVEALARSSLERPGARGTDAFWNAEILGDSDSADDSLACVAVPVHGDGDWLGLLGVVDTWLPELDEEQRQGLIRLSRVLGQRLAEGGTDLSNGLAQPTEPIVFDQVETVSAPLAPPSPPAPSPSKPVPPVVPDQGTQETPPPGDFSGEGAEHPPAGPP